MTLEFLAATLPEMKLATEGAPTFGGYASVFNVVDSVNDVVLPGAFAKSIAKKGPRRVKFLYQHDPSRVIGEITAMEEDKKGLKVAGEFYTDIPDGQMAYSLAKRGALDGLSIGYKTIADQVTGKGVRNLSEVDLWEVSLVTFPANDKARVDRVKAAPVLDIEFLRESLRDRGYSRTKTDEVIYLVKQSLADAGAHLPAQTVDADMAAQHAAISAAADRLLSALRS